MYSVSPPFGHCPAPALHPMMNAFRLSGEKPAVVAPAMLRGVDVEEVATKTWLGVWKVSEKMAVFPFGETANTVPVTVPRAVNGLLLPPMLATVMSCAP